MLIKFFSGARKCTPQAQPEQEMPSSALKIMHAGGKVERYYMAVPAARIMDKYPSFTLARSEVFRRPWDSLVRPDEILVPGQKYLVVPNRTVRKLMRRIRRPIFVGDEITMGNRSFVSAVSTNEVFWHKNEGFSSNSFAEKSTCVSCMSSGTKVKGKKAKSRVRFSVVDCNDGKKKPGKAAQISDRKARVRSSTTWQPSLTVIDERRGSD